MLSSAIIAMLLIQNAYSGPLVDNGEALTGSKQQSTGDNGLQQCQDCKEFNNFIEKQGLSLLHNGKDKLTAFHHGSKSMLLQGRYTFGQLDSIIQKAKTLLGDNYIPKDGELPLQSQSDSNEKVFSVGGQHFNGHYLISPSVTNFNVFNAAPPCEKRSPCDRNPCKNHGLCEENSSGNNQDYHCKCPSPMGGKNCTEVQCGGELCFQHGDYVIYIYKGRSLTWANAKLQCELKNMSLVKIPDEDTNEFVRRALLSVYANDHTSQHCYYNGLYRDNEYDNFRWTDGSPLGDYRPWSSGELKGQCVVMCNTRKFYFYWDIDPCNLENNNWQYYYICGRELTF